MTDPRRFGLSIPGALAPIYSAPSRFRLSPEPCRLDPGACLQNALGSPVRLLDTP
jgi:hypothetical protein